MSSKYLLGKSSCFLKYIYYTYYFYILFFYVLSQALKNIKKKKRRDGETGKQKLNEMGVLNMNRKSETNWIKEKDHHFS